MRTRTVCSVFVLLAALGGCATPPAPSAPTAAVWNDSAFDYDPALVTVTKKSLFALDDAMREALRRGGYAERGAAGRTSALLTLVFGSEMKAFAYIGGHSTAAAETWHHRRGDCLSLSIMSVALARALDVPAQVQEVRVPPVFDRRGGVDFVNRHVNVMVRTDQEVRALGRVLPVGAIIVDFEPQVGSRQRGTRLSDEAVLSRFLNNLGGEHLARGDHRRAYAHFRAAIEAEPAYAASYANLAQLYLLAGLQADAERLLRQALQIDADNTPALAALHGLLFAQGHDAEALLFEQRLQARRDEDPYYWLGLGIAHLQHERDPMAVAALERAQALASGFEEVHRLLAVAYWRTGQPHRARDQLAILSAVGTNDAKLALLQRKFQGSPAPTP